MMKYNEALQKAGVLLALDGLHPPSMGARVSFAGGKPKVTDGPFAEAKEVLGGYWMIQVKSKEEAIEWASRCPGLGQRDHRDPPGAGVGGLPGRCPGSRGRLSRAAGAVRAAPRRVTPQHGDSLRRRIDDAVIGSHDGYRHPSRHRRRMAHRISPTDRRPRAQLRWSMLKNSAADMAPTRCRPRSPPAMPCARTADETDWPRIAALYDGTRATHVLAHRGTQSRGRAVDGVRPGGGSRTRRHADRGTVAGELSLAAECAW